MIKLLPQIVFSSVMLIFGLSVVSFTEKIRAWALKKGGDTKLADAQTIWSMRFGGSIAILIGLFILWMSWRYYHDNV
jgi:uncharacterized membrane protein